jgi:superfamily I DNA and RNA helicase
MLDPSRRLVYAYDELQNLAGRSLPPPEEIFGIDEDGRPRVTFDEEGRFAPRRDIILEVCYRNSRPVLVTAHGLGFGIYRKKPEGRSTGLVQMFDHPPLWTDIGYRVDDGSLTPGHRVVLKRTEETSPRFLEEHSPIDDLVEFHRFDSVEDQDLWLIEAIKTNLTRDELKHDDIVVINPDPTSTRKIVGPIRAKLFEMGIASHLAGVDTDPDIFFRTDSPSITFTGIFRAKGNEAGMVYIINADAGQASPYNLATVRNRLFTSITRSKAWVRVLGVGSGMTRLSREYAALKQHEFKLDFVYPTEEERANLQIVHRDMTKRQREVLEERQRSLLETIAALESGEIQIEDISPELRARLQALLGET